MKKNSDKSSNICVDTYATAYGNTNSLDSNSINLPYYDGITTNPRPDTIGSTYTYISTYGNYIPDIKIMQKGEKIIFYFFKDSNIHYSIYDGDSVSSFKFSDNLLFLEEIL